MCHFASFVIEKRTEKIYASDLKSHSGIEEGWNLRPDSYRECEWREEDDGKSLTIRVTSEEDCSFYKASILGRWPTRKDFLASITYGKGENSEYRFDNGVIIETKVYHDNGQLAFHAEYKDGEEVKCEEWYEDGKRMLIGESRGDIYVVTRWHKNGKKASEIIYDESRDNLIRETGWYEDGKVEYTSLYDEDGNFTLGVGWHQNGMISYAQCYGVNDSKIYYKRWYPSGIMHTDSEYYEESNKRRSVKVWYPSGLPMVEEEYEKDGSYTRTTYEDGYKSKKTIRFNKWGGCMPYGEKENDV